MSDFKQVFSDEIRRLSRKEVKAALEPLTKSLSIQRQTIIELRRQIKALEKLTGYVAPAAPEKAAEKSSDGKKVVRRITDKRIVDMRGKMKLSQAQFAALLDVSLSTIVNWEKGKRVPRPAQKEKLAGLRALGKREIAKRLAAAGLAAKPSRRKAVKKSVAAKKSEASAEKE